MDQLTVHVSIRVCGHEQAGCLSPLPSVHQDYLYVQDKGEQASGDMTTS